MINCRHVFYPFVEELSNRRYVQYNARENTKAYQESQQQRKLERDIRKEKRKLAMSEAMNDKEGIETAKQRVRDKQKTMRDFIEQTGRRRFREREQIL